MRTSASANRLVKKVLHQAGVQDGTNESRRTVTKSGWCLRQGLQTLCSVQEDGLPGLSDLVDRHGVPAFYVCLKDTKQARHDATQDLKDPSTCFESLCRIIVGQFVSGASAQAAWKRLLDTMSSPERKASPQSLTPSLILARVQQDGVEGGLQKPAGLTKAKAASIVDLATHFESGSLSEEFLESPSSSDDNLRRALLSVRGIGPWSCDMFLMFYLERSNVLPLGDLGVRKGILQHFGVCPQKNPGRVQETLRPFEPFLSLVSYYMWRVVDTDLSATKRKKRDQAAVVMTNDAGTPAKKSRMSRTVTP